MPSSNDDITIFELEQKILSTLNKLCDLVESTKTPNELADAEQLFATAVHMSKSKNDVGAAKFMRQAALSGHVKAQFYLGLMFVKGQGLPQSEYHAFTWLTLAESQGSIESIEVLAKINPLLQAKQKKDAKKQAADLYEQIYK